MNIAVQSWLDLQAAMPIDPRTVLLNATLGPALGTFVRSTNLLQSSWSTNTVGYTGNNSLLLSLDTTDATTSIYAQQWNASHKMVNVGVNIPPNLTKVAFMKAGNIWDNMIEINFPFAYTNVQLTLRDNLATSEQFLNGSTGSIPAFSFGTVSAAPIVLHVTIAQPGIYSMVLGMLFSGNWSTFEMEWVVMP